MLSVAPESPRQPEVEDLFRQSTAMMLSLYRPESTHLVSAEFLSAPNVRFFVARLDGRAVGCGALVLGKNGQAEVKRMFVTEEARGQGAGKAVLQAIEEAARREGVRLLQLETGIHNRAAIMLYRVQGYRSCGPFGDYRPDPISVFLEKTL